jgi:hypothetical protein
VCSLYDQTQHLETKVGVLKSQTRNVLKISLMEEELKDWEIFAFDLLQSHDSSRNFDRKCSHQDTASVNGELTQLEGQHLENAIAESWIQDLCGTVVISLTNSPRLRED